MQWICYWGIFLFFGGGAYPHHPRKGVSPPLNPEWNIIELTWIMLTSLWNGVRLQENTYQMRLKNEK